MRIAFAGKGGTGKTTIAATVARWFARRGAQVIAIDADSNPNLAVALGMPRHDPRATALPSTLVSRRLDRPGLNAPIATVLDRHAMTGPDGVRVLAMGMPAHAEEGCMCSAHATISALLGELGNEEDSFTVVDLEASPEHLGRGTTRHIDNLILVTEPYYRSLEAARRLAVLARELPIPRIGVVANKVRSVNDSEAIREFCQRHALTLEGEVPWTEAVIEADLSGIAALDDQRCAEVTTAIGRLADQLVGSLR